MNDPFGAERNARLLCQAHDLELREGEATTSLVDPSNTLVVSVPNGDPCKWRILQAAALGYAAGYEVG